MVDGGETLAGVGIIDAPVEDDSEYEAPDRLLICGLILVRLRAGGGRADQIGAFEHRDSLRAIQLEACESH